MSWDEAWVAPGVELYGDDAWAHHDLAVTAEGHIVGFRSGGDRVWILDADGQLVGAWSSDLGEGHGLTIAGRPEAQELWVADPAITFARDAEGVHDAVFHDVHGRVVAYCLDGRVIAELPTPAAAIYADEVYRPTTVAVDDGCVWVADGYGASLVHQLSREGELLRTLTGEEGAGRFDCPHGVFIDRRRPDEPRLYITDRGHNRIVVYDLDGTFLYALDEGWRAPSAFALRGDQLVVAELEARVTILDRDDQVVERIGDDPQAMARPGWPNDVDADGRTLVPQRSEGRFIAPHGLAVDADGRICVAEFVLGGRMIRID